MILQVLFYAELETFVLKCKFNSKSLAPPLKISGCAIDYNYLRKSANFTRVNNPLYFGSALSLSGRNFSSL